MLDSILYNVQSIKMYLILFLLIGAAIIIFLYNKTKKLKETKTCITLYGLLMNLNDKDLIKIILNIIKYTVIIFCAWNYESSIGTFLFMIIISTIIYIVLQWNFKFFVIELFNTLIIIIALYVIYTLGNYISEIGVDFYLQLVLFIISIFITIYAIYFFFRNYDEIMQYHISQLRRNKNEKGKNY